MGGSKKTDEKNDEDQWDGIPEPEVTLIDHEEEYIDEDKYTTVTVEEVEISREGLDKLRGSDAEEDGQEDEGEKDQPAESSVKSIPKKSTTTSKKEKLNGVKKRKKKRDFKYENKADRKMNRLKIRAKNSKQAKARRGD